MIRLLIPVLLLLAGCVAPLPPMPEDSVAKRFEPVPGKAVIYLARHALEPAYIAPVMLDDQMIGSTYRGSYIRIEVPAGKHHLAGIAGDSGEITLNTEPGKIYFVQHNAHGYRSFVSSTYHLVDASYGRSLVMGGEISALVTR